MSIVAEKNNTYLETVLPNDMKINHIHDYETDYLYHEIFEENTYLKQGIQLPENACVIDIGANIGIFSLFIHCHCRNAKIYACEPIASTYQVLKMNMDRYQLGVALQCGVSNQDGEQIFKHYQNSTVFSGKYATPQLDQQKIKAIASNVIKKNFDISFEEIEEYVNLFTNDRTIMKEEKVSTKTLSTIIKENEISKIDLLKIDAEGSEMDILSGIKSEDWDRIGQIVMEVHVNEQISLPNIISILEEHKFSVQHDCEALLDNSGFINVYAKKAIHINPIPKHYTIL